MLLQYKWMTEPLRSPKDNPWTPHGARRPHGVRQVPFGNWQGEYFPPLRCHQGGRGAPPGCQERVSPCTSAVRNKGWTTYPLE
ncbi:hypothetical protein Pmani_031989 [Petrolisthes manimaculis]|uniref:Uncharacterized protein n=1 Tax=Petrolisthes manimaculis TaxID=1843537 RepID=A0AAE1TRW2_9EUCA|nr:hypothetical protein Pmani_031989 [Petrolisthes manimaculis]